MSASVETITAYAVPSRAPSSNASMDRRSWILRFRAPIAHSLDLDGTSLALTDAAVSAVCEARKVRSLGLDAELAHAPVVRIVALAERHAVMSVETVRLESDEAHEYLVAAVAALGAIEKIAAVEDIQGIPRQFWRHLIGSASGIV